MERQTSNRIEIIIIRTFKKLTEISKLDATIYRWLKGHLTDIEYNSHNHCTFEPDNYFIFYELNMTSKKLKTKDIMIMVNVLLDEIKEKYPGLNDENNYLAGELRVKCFTEHFINK